ncbi:MAG: hypothetical protein NT075_22235 [Chloroflexi bacterium]|nr:hypothetical protein [Chloroflexota bacterium]
MTRYRCILLMPISGLGVRASPLQRAFCTSQVFQRLVIQGAIALPQTPHLLP